MKKQGTAYEEIIEWLETHDGKMPKSHAMNEEEKQEEKLYKRWYKSEERQILDDYKEMSIDEVPEEYREKIKTLRSYGLGITTYEEMIHWLETHNGKKPRTSITKNGKWTTKEELTDEESEEINLSARWSRSKEYEIVENYAELPIEEVPKEYREKVKILRQYRNRSYSI